VEQNCLLLEKVVETEMLQVQKATLKLTHILGRSKNCTISSWRSGPKLTRLNKRNVRDGRHLGRQKGVPPIHPIKDFTFFIKAATGNT
jgi:hypothetical protein